VSEDITDTIICYEPEDTPLWRPLKGIPPEGGYKPEPPPEPLPPIEEDFGTPRWLEWQADIAEKAGNAYLAKGLRVSAEWLNQDY